MLNDFDDNGPILAVVGGRFIPVKYLAIEVDGDYEQMQSVGGDQLFIETQASTNIGIRTARKPEVDTAAPQDIYIRNRKYKILIEKASVTEYGALMDGFEPVYDIEFSASSYTVKNATASFL